MLGSSSAALVDPFAKFKFDLNKDIAGHKSQKVGADNKDEGVQQFFEIEYMVVNMVYLLSTEKRGFMNLIKDASEKDISYLELPIIQHVINFKWDTYTRDFFIFQFYKSLVFFGAFVADIITTSPDGYDYDPAHIGSLYLVSNIITRGICTLYILDHIRYEYRQLMIGGKKLDYILEDFWNTIDVMLFLSYMIYLPISFIYDPETYLVKAIQCLIVLIYSVKFNFYLRMFDKFGFLVQMVVAVFFDLRYFIIYFCMIVSFFSVQVSLILRNTEGHDGIGPIKFFVMVLRSSLGDNDIDQQYAEFKILFWIIWFIIMVTGNIVLMNFIIAVVGESYANCMATHEAQTYKVKVDMIMEREQMLDEKALANADWFPKYIVVRRPVDGGASLEDEEEALNHFLTKEIKKISENIEEFAATSKTDTGKVQEECKEMREALKAVAEIKEQIKTMAEIKEQIKTMAETISTIQTNTAPPAPPTRKATESDPPAEPAEEKKEKEVNAGEAPA